MKVLILLFLISSGYWLSQETWVRYPTFSTAEKLQWVWAKDLENLKRQNALPKSWSEIRSIEVSTHKNSQVKWLEDVKLPISINASGQRHLEVEILPWKEEKDAGVTIHYHLIDTRDQNTVWEFGRTLKL